MNQELQSKFKHYRINQQEYDLICDLLKRPPQGVEWALFSALWSEHCSYKSSKVHLRKFGKTINQTVVTAEGENAGIIDCGFDEKIVFKMESHNHPSFIEPYQGAATGVGGILRDIFTMGARPIASANYLCFGDLNAPRMKTLLKGVVSGISGYGNSVGVPTVTGQTEFHESYNNNILVNAMCVGLIEPGSPIALSKASGVGNFVVYVGAKTGKDGVHGAAMASEAFDSDIEKKKPNVQIGDPFFEKLLIEACLEIIHKKLVVAIQDMGAAGLTSSSFEMASKGKVGMRIDLDKVPLRDPSMNPEEILLSESQERMLLVCTPDKFKEIEEILRKWGLEAAKIGEITENKNVRLMWHQELLTDIDPDLLVENAPKYERKFNLWSAKNKVANVAINGVINDESSSVKAIENLLKDLDDPRIADRKNIYRQYDQRVGTKTAHGAECDVAILRLQNSGRGLAIAVGCRPSVIRLDAQLGAYDSVLYPSLQMAIKGAKPIGLTDCLNFGNPEKPEIMSEFVACVEAITDCAVALEAPVISGNVSFYNETQGKNITSTPAIGVVGIRDDADHLPQDRFCLAGNDVVLVSLESVKAQLGSDFEWQKFSGEFNLPQIAGFIKSMAHFSHQEKFFSSQVVGRQGLLLELAKMSMSGIGIDIHPSVTFGPVQTFYQMIFEVKNFNQFSARFEKFFTFLKKTEISFTYLGKTTASEFKTKHKTFQVSQLQEKYRVGLPL
jgi:phosphoribosylformylglycinamidine synthase